MRKPQTSIFAIDRKIIICLLLVLSIMALYGKVRHYDFINFDDNVYVYQNPNILSGLTKESLVWSVNFQEKDKNYWHPLTWLSHLLDVELYGLDPGGHHLTNVAYHTVNTVLLFIVLNWMTGAVWRSAFVAILFAVHPLNVESVAWVSERKNVLSTFFWMLTLLAYTHYSLRPRFWRYAALCIAFALGLMAKPMLVTLPFTLILLDYWPLRRWSLSALNRGEGRRKSNTQYIILEKVPLLLLSTLTVYISSKSIQGEGDVTSLQLVPMLLRIENALVSYVKYIGKMIWPQNLSVYYPFPDMVPAGQLIGAVAVLVALSSLAVWGLKRRPYLAVGWFWFLGSLVPVIGFVQVGLWPEMADRWAYVPLIGLFIMIAWGIPELIKGWHNKHKILAITAGAILLLLSITTRVQISYWADNVTLFKHAVQSVDDASIPRNKLGHAFILNNLAFALMEEGKTDDAIINLTAALNLVPDSPRINYNLGYIFLRKGKIDEAIGQFKQAIKLNPEYFLAHYDLAGTLMQTGKLDDAVSHYHAALDLKPDDNNVLNDLANTLVAQGRISEALSFYSKALRLNPKDPDIYNNMGVALIHQGRFEEAVRYFRMALQLNPNFVNASENLEKALSKQP
jgi:Tfp pilus assembly protein PilF